MARKYHKILTLRFYGGYYNEPPHPRQQTHQPPAHKEERAECFSGIYIVEWYENPLSFEDFKAAILSLLPDHRLNNQPGYEQLPAMYSQGWNAAINKMLQNIAIKPDDTIHRNFTGQTDTKKEEQ
jgi:hypothetical protein